MANLPSREVLREMFEYEPAGRLIWRARPRSHFPTSRGHSIFNKRYAGKPALTAKDGKGYLCGNFGGGRKATHRVIWAYFYGEPEGEIDHINGDRSDNRIENLRLVDRTTNGRNLGKSKSNKTGVTGVRLMSCGRWWAYIKVDYRQIGLGSHGCITSAALARKLAEQKYGFHENHGAAR